jgi:hypothetical protein
MTTIKEDNFDEEDGEERDEITNLKQKTTESRKSYFPMRNSVVGSVKRLMTTVSTPKDN